MGVCMYMFVCLYACMWKPEVGDCCLFHTLSSSVFETGSLTDHGAMLDDALVSASPIPGSQ